VRKWKKNLDVAASVLGSSIGEWAYAKLNGLVQWCCAMQLRSSLLRNCAVGPRGFFAEVRRRCGIGWATDLWG
jgi:hypothetical protein